MTYVEPVWPDPTWVPLRDCAWTITGYLIEADHGLVVHEVSPDVYAVHLNGSERRVGSRAEIVAWLRGFDEGLGRY